MMSKVNAAIAEYLNTTGLKVDLKKLLEAGPMPPADQGQPEPPPPAPGMEADAPPTDAAMPPEHDTGEPAGAGEPIEQTTAGEHHMIMQLGQALGADLEDDDRERAIEITRKLKGPNSIIKPENSRREALPELKAILGKYTGHGEDVALSNNPATSDEFPPEGI
tara:strand:- start:366 stop:857 length:492 start_codon:yes stop_codon:yes gene_type:complete